MVALIMTSIEYTEYTRIDPGPSAQLLHLLKAHGIISPVEFTVTNVVYFKYNREMTMSFDIFIQ